MCKHPEIIWFESVNEIDFQDLLLHAIMVVGFNLRLLYDEVHKMRIENFTEVSGIEGTGRILLFIPDSTKKFKKR